jgi:hypothetical protein
MLLGGLQVCNGAAACIASYELKVILTREPSNSKFQHEIK